MKVPVRMLTQVRQLGCALVWQMTGKRKDCLQGLLVEMKTLVMTKKVKVKAYKPENVPILIQNPSLLYF